MLSARAKCSLDVVVCTHNDKDHAEGIRGLLERATRVWWSRSPRAIENAGNNLSEEAPREFADAVWELALRNEIASYDQPGSILA